MAVLVPIFLPYGFATDIWGMYKVLLFAAIAVAAVACSKNDSSTQSTPATVKGLMPLTVGNQWTYKKNMLDSLTGAVKSTSTDNINILSAISINDTTYFQQSQTSFTIGGNSFFLNTDSNTVMKIDSNTRYTFFKRVTTDNSLIGVWADTVKSRCTGKNYLYGFTGDTTINGYTGCLKNVVLVNDCTGLTFEKWVYYLKPSTGLVRIEHYLLAKDNATLYLDFTEDLTAFQQG